MATLAEVKAQIRFALEQLSAKNAHHEFEHLCLDLARLRICSNVLPATCPVAAGGDQGHDFETFRTPGPNPGPLTHNVGIKGATSRHLEPTSSRLQLRIRLSSVLYQRNAWCFLVHWRRRKILQRRSRLISRPSCRRAHQSKKFTLSAALTYQSQSDTNCRPGRRTTIRSISRYMTVRPYLNSFQIAIRSLLHRNI